MILNQHMAAFLNQKLNGLADTEPVFAFNESEAGKNTLYALFKLDLTRINF